MIAKQTDGLLVCLAAARAGNLDLGIIERADPNWQLSVGRTYNVAFGQGVRAGTEQLVLHVRQLCHLLSF